jgi:hypothetical protein
MSLQHQTPQNIKQRNFQQKRKERVPEIAVESQENVQGKAMHN